MIGGVGLFLDTARAVITSLKERANELAATTLLEETLRVINGFAEPHWRASSISEIPDMIRELARDRDDFKRMSIAYREDLANAEEKIRKLDAALNVATARLSLSSRHESWCNVRSACNCYALDEEDT